MSPDEKPEVLDNDKKGKVSNTNTEKEVAKAVAKEETPAPVSKVEKPKPVVEKPPPKKKEKKETVKPSGVHICPDCNRKYMRTHVCKATGKKYENGKVKEVIVKERTPLVKDKETNYTPYVFGGLLGLVGVVMYKFRDKIRDALESLRPSYEETDYEDEGEPPRRMPFNDLYQ